MSMFDSIRASLGGTDSKPKKTKKSNGATPVDDGFEVLDLDATPEKPAAKPAAPAPKPVEKPAEKPAAPEKPAEKPAEKPTEKPAAKPATPAPKPAEKPVEKSGSTSMPINMTFTPDDFAKFFLWKNPDYIKEAAIKVAKEDQKFAEKMSKEFKYAGVAVFYELGNKLYDRDTLKGIVGGADISGYKAHVYYVDKSGNRTDEEHFGPENASIIATDLKKYNS